jgi:hypothetical protein
LPLAAALITAAPLIAAFPPASYGPPTVTVPHVIIPEDSCEGGVAVREAVRKVTGEEERGEAGREAGAREQPETQ